MATASFFVTTKPEVSPSADEATSGGGCWGGFLGGGGIYSNRQQHHHRRKQTNGSNTPSTSSSMKSSSDEFDAALAKEMNELSVTEREKVLDDIHGVATIQEEAPTFISKLLREMDLALGVLPKVKRKALDRALFFKPSLLDDLKFKLMFLRADNYDPPLAAKRLARHFEEKLDLFGEGKLTKDITLEDLQPEDIENLGYVGCAKLPHKDQSGRPIWYFNIPQFNFDNPESMYRCNWYQIMSTLTEDEDAQLKGICDVVYCPGDMLLKMPSSFNKISKMARRNGKMIEGLPCRISTFHFCYDDPRVKFVITALGSHFGKNVRLRIRTHYGSAVEIQYSLMTFGIACHYLFNDSPEKKLLIHDQRIQFRRELETRDNEKRLKSEASSGKIPYPQFKDVLVGRGRPYQDFPGNQRLGTFVEAQLPRYTSTGDKFEKTCIILEVVKNVRDDGGRFIQKVPESEGNWWILATDKAAREKTCSAFRNKMGKSGNAAKERGNKHSHTDTSTTSDPMGDSIGSGGGNTTDTSSCNNNDIMIGNGRSAKRLRIDPSLLSSSAMQC